MVEDEEEQFVYQPNFLGQYSSGGVQPKASMGEALGARFQESFFPKAIRLWNTPDFEQEVGFEPMADPLFADGGPLAQVKHKFSGARSQSELSYQLDRYYQEIENLRKINNSEADYGLGFLQDLVTDPITYVPLIGPWARGAKASHRAMASGSAAFAMTVPYEAVMRADSMTRTNAESAITLGAMFTIAGATGAAFGRRGRSFYADNSNAASPKPRSLGAAAPVDPEDLSRQESLRPTGTGLESAPLTPIVRLLDSKDPYTVGVATDLTETSGMILNKVDDQIPMTNDSVTVKFRTTYLKPLHDAIEAADNAFLKFRGATPSSTSALSNSVKMAALRMQELGTRNNLRLEFNKRVGLALMRGGDNVDDSMSPFINEAAKSYRQVLDLVRGQGEQVGLFAKEFEKQLAKLRKDSDGNAPAIRRLESKIANLRSMGAAATINSKGYFPRIYDVDYLLSNQGRSQWFRTLAPVVGNDSAQAAYNKITNSFDDTIEGFEGLLEDVAAGASKARMLDVDDELLVPFLDFNVEAVVRDHVRRMGMDIELTRKFGSISMDDIIDRLPTSQAKRDVTALRDIIRGTYGRPSDPYSHLNRGITLLKNFSPLVYMGGAAVSSLPDIARPIMTEGINAFAGTMLKKFRSQNREIIKQMNRKMVREVGEALDMTLSMRAFAMADIGSTFGRQSRIERTIKDLQAPFFLLNGLNIWNTVMKEFAGLTISQRMFRAMRTDWQKLNKADKERLLANGIDGPMAARINAMMNVEGFSTKVDGMVFPELGRWTDTGAADTFKRALNQQINRTIVTPDVGDRALWTQTHVGSMIAQFKSFGQASTNRVLISGLQERNANFYMGAIAMTGLGILVNEIKDFQYGSTKERTWGQVLSDGIDRAGLLAIFSDINHALETVSSNRVGLDALAGGQPTNYGGVRRTIGEFGPSASILYDFGNMVSETFQGEAFSKSFMGSMRRTTPYMSHPLFPGFLYE